MTVKQCLTVLYTMKTNGEETTGPDTRDGEPGLFNDGQEGRPSPKECLDGQTAEGNSAEGSRETVGVQGYIYFFETEDSQYVKIGYASKVSRRMAQISTLVPMRMIGYFPGSYATESWLHQKFAGDWHTGEWFRSSSELREFVQMMGLLTVPPEPDPPREIRYKPQPTGEPNPAAVALAARRMKTMTAEERSEVGRKGGKARLKTMTPEQRSEIARKAGLAGGRGRKKK
jgi:hypothetical protein